MSTRSKATALISRTFWAARRRAEAERTRHQAPHATQTVRHVCGRSSDGQTSFSDRHASYESRGAKFIGRVGAELDVEAGRKAAHLAALNVLAVARQHLGSLDKVTRVVRLDLRFSEEILRAFDKSSADRALAKCECRSCDLEANKFVEGQAPTAEMAVTPPSIRKSAPTTYAESSDAR
jgi:hypothetical protein